MTKRSTRSHCRRADLHQSRTIEAADNEAQLAAVMAHETPTWPCATAQTRPAKPLPRSCHWVSWARCWQQFHGCGPGTARRGLHFEFLLLKYSRTDESQADIMGTQILYDSGYDPRGMGQFLEKIQALDQGNHRVAFFSDHPSPTAAWRA